MVDSLTVQFSKEIGPARQRPANAKHESWVFASKGTVRGVTKTLDDKSWEHNAAEDPDKLREVVQLKYLQKSNEEQMEKLFQLLRFEPLLIHNYLQTIIFPEHMRSQNVKISASGQAVGGDMLVKKRGGFSGTVPV